jgi:hypothetical protein
MKSFLIAASAAIALFAAADAQAAVTYYRSNYQARTYAQPTYSTGGYYYSNGYSRSSGGPFGRLMEMERRKNAALRRMFWGY